MSKVEEATAKTEASGTARAPEPAPKGEVARREAEPPSFWTDPFGYMRRFNEELDRVFHGFGFGRLGGFPEFGRLVPTGWLEETPAIWSPQIELAEREGNLVVRADLPGLRKEDIKVEVEDNVLTIQGERRSEKEEKNEKWYRSERSYGSFRRVIPLPEGTGAAKATAEFKDGVLEICMPAPAKPERRARKLDIG